MTTFDKAVTLRRLVADTLDTGFTSDSLCLNFHTISFEDFATDSFLKKFADNSGAGYCGLAASILCKTLNDHGINAYTYNFGFKGTRFTHVLVVAQTDDNEWTVHDPYFNYSITDSLGEPLDFFLMMENLALKNHSNLLFSTDTVTRDVHVND
ncbi:MAG: hypothetical protein K9J17_05730, partial [Flavobacteriales bacterium]|nr:hypothetical protein [Flavobacteriales bacterium]